MTDREAIKILEGFYHSEKAEKYGDVPQARGLAISALQEKIEREKGCEHCNNIAMPPKGGPHEFIILDNGLYYYCSEYGWEGTVIEHCPWCGRKLKGEEE